MMLNPTTTDRIVSPLAASATVAIEIAKNIGMTVPAIRRLRTKMGRTALPPEPEQLRRYVFDLLGSVMNYGEGSPESQFSNWGRATTLSRALRFWRLGQNPIPPLTASQVLMPRMMRVASTGCLRMTGRMAHGQRHSILTSSPTTPTSLPKE